MTEKAPISVLIPAKNEAANLADCIASAAFCSEVVVVDSGSSDGSVAIAEAAGARVVQFAWNKQLPRKKNWALANISWRNEWVFILDADERITPELAHEISAIAREAGTTAGPHGFFVNRRFWFLDGWLKHCGYYPSWNLRFFRHKLGRYEQDPGSVDPSSGDNEVHEHVVLQGEARYLAGEMEHYAFPDIYCWLEKHNRYSNWEARRQSENTRSETLAALEPSLARKRRLRELAWRLPFRPTLRFLYHYVARAGFLDGFRGWVFCRLMAQYEFWCVAKASEMRRQSGERRG